MKRFSEREGYKAIKDKLQIESIDEELRNGLWNALIKYYFRMAKRDSDVTRIFQTVWHNYFKKPLDDMGVDLSDTYSRVRKYFFSCKWNEVYDFIEFLANTGITQSIGTYDPRQIYDKDFINVCNYIFELEVSGYRFVGKIITPITSKVEINEIEESLKRTDKLSSINQHLNQALVLLSDRKKPDYRNSIKESISAVEALCKIISKNDKATLGDALKFVKNKIGLHPALEKSFSSLYGYTSSADGIRHSLLEESKLNFEDAKFFLVSCSAFINYLISKSSRLNIDLT